MKHKTLTFRFLDMSRGGFARLFLLLLLPCLSVIGVKAANSNGGVKFNPDVRYSQWAINSRLYDFRGNQNAYGFAKWNSGTETLEEYANKKNMKLDYVAGLVGKATLEASDYYVDFDWAKPWFKSAQAYATDYQYSAQEQAKMTLDNMNAAKMAFHIINNNKWGEDAAKTTAKNAIEAIITDLKYYNEYYVIGGTKSNVKKTTANDVQKTMLDGWFHKYNYVDQVWCDGMYMGPALLAQIIKHTGKTNNISDNDWDIIAKQFSITWAQLYDNNTGLLYHGFTANPGDDASASWAGISKENGIYHSASFWGRANAWYFLALVDILEVMPKDNAYYTTFKDYLAKLAEGIKNYQDETTGCWYQVMDKVPASLTGNYLEASCSSIFTAGYLKAIRLGLLDKPTYEPVAKKAYEGLVNQFMVYDNTDNSTIQLVHSCTSAGLGGKDSRKGDDNYYLTGKDAKVVTSSDPTSPYYYTEGKVLGGFIMAATEYERAYQNQDNKQILFAKDLAPKYDFSTTAGELDATAYGSVEGTVSYQWYKSDGTKITKITNATSATYTPTESGEYYCVAKSGNTNITTSKTNVTAKSNSNTNNGSTDNNNGGSDNGTASEGTVTFSGDQLKNYSSPMTDASKVVTITTSKGTIKKESDGDIKVAKDAAFTISVAEGKYIKSITYTIKDVSKGELTFSTTDANKVTSSDNLTYTYNYSDNKTSSVTATNRANKGGIQVTSIEVVYGTISTENKYKVSATAETGGSVSIANASGAAVTSGTEVEANTSLTFTATPNEGYEFVNWTDASNNEVSTNATYKATVTAAISLTANFKAQTTSPSPLNVSVMDVTINTTDAEEEQPVIKVYGDNDKLLKLGQDYTLSYAVSGDNNVTVDETTGKFSVTKNAEKTAFIKGTSIITVTATPTASLGSNYTVGTLQFSYSVSEGKIKPVFLESFKDITINLHQDATSREINVPLIHDGEDVSSYFKYTYKINGQAQEVTQNTLNYTPSTAGTYTVTVTAEPALIGTDDYRDVYDSPDVITFTLNVDSKYQTISVTPDPKTIEMYAGTTHDAPDLTVTNGKTTLGDTEYKVTWFSTSPGVVKVDATTGKIEAVSEGTAEIRVVVTGDNIESTTAPITVKVDDRAMYRVKGSGETYENQRRMWNQDYNMSVVLGGWLFSDDKTKKVETPNTSSEGLSAGYYWGPGATKAKWKLTGFDYYVAGNNNKNARQENGSNALPETTDIYSADFVKYHGTIKDKMFNVPCSGSFLEFNPATNGKVTVHIFQNGAFDAKTTKEKDGTVTIDYQYRPQRRVFVMDEAGNFVESTAHIESTTGKPTGGINTINKYKWDLDDSKTLTIEDVRSHFKGIPTTFDMTTDGFKNNVYESLLDTKKVPNAAAGKGNGSLGWSVLADSPVTYTFNVKAGKTYYLYNFGSKIGFYGFSFDEDETTPEVDEVNYNADDANANNEVVKTAEGHVAQVKIVRQMVANRWTTCVLPFSLNRQQVDAIFGPAYSAANPKGTQILYFDHVEGSKAYFVRHAYNTIVAGKPFLIKPTKEVTSINTAEVTDYPYVTIENTEPNDWCESNGYVWTSSYNKMNIVKNDYFIGASDGKFKAYSGDSGIVKGFRGFLKADHSAGSKPTMLSISTSSITDGNDGETTGIEDLIITADGELMPANSRVYNINGQLVSEDASNFQSLPSGIYIINGKKYIK